MKNVDDEIVVGDSGEGVAAAVGRDGGVLEGTNDIGPVGAAAVDGGGRSRATGGSDETAGADEVISEGGIEKMTVGKLLVALKPELVDEAMLFYGIVDPVNLKVAELREALVVMSVKSEVSSASVPTEGSWLEALNKYAQGVNHSATASVLGCTPTRQSRSILMAVLDDEDSADAIMSAVLGGSRDAEQSRLQLRSESVSGLRFFGGTSAADEEASVRYAAADEEASARYAEQQQQRPNLQLRPDLRPPAFAPASTRG